jgi:hypothetical protein
LANDDVTKNCQIFGRFSRIFSDFQKIILVVVIFENFPKINNVRRKIFKYVTEKLVRFLIDSVFLKQIFLTFFTNFGL